MAMKMAQIHGSFIASLNRHGELRGRRIIESISIIISLFLLSLYKIPIRTYEYMILSTHWRLLGVGVM